MAPIPLSVHALVQFNSPSSPDTFPPPCGCEESPFPLRSQEGEMLEPLTLRAMHSSDTFHPAQQEEPVPIKSSIVHKFYEPVILLVSLTDVIKPPSSPSSLPGPSLGTRDNDLQTFKTFVNKLSHVCSSSKGRETVTSFVVLRKPTRTGTKLPGVHYWFAANEQAPAELHGTQRYVQSLLLKVGRAPSSCDSEESDAARKELHYDVLVFNRPRISSYLSEIQGYIAECLKSCASSDNSEDKVLSRHLEDLTDPENLGASVKSRETEYISKVQMTIRLLLRLQKSAAYPALMHRAEEGRLLSGSSLECFSNFLHTSQRILAYPQSVQYIMTVAKANWPELFNNPIVYYLPSSKPIPKPCREKSLTAVSIVNRMTRKEKQIIIFKDFVKRLQVFDLDERIKAEYAKDSFHPVVHSEVLLLNWLWNNYGGAAGKAIDASVFFNGWMYIGSSKPSCRLCHYYFEERRSGVESRGDWDGNLYPAWAFPEVFPSQGPEAIDDRQVMIDRVLQRVRKEAFEVVRKKIAPRHKAEDSNTFSDGVTLEERWTIQPSEVGVEELSSIMGEISVDGGDTENGGALL